MNRHDTYIDTWEYQYHDIEMLSCFLPSNSIAYRLIDRMANFRLSSKIHTHNYEKLTSTVLYTYTSAMTKVNLHVYVN